MDPRLEATDAPRPGVSDALADLPLVTLAWRTLRTQYQRLDRQRRDGAQETAVLEAALVAVADEVHRLRRQGDAPAGPAADRLEKALAEAGIGIVSPEGEAYTPELMEVLENVAPVPDPELTGPRVKEVLEPAVTYRGAVLRMGRAVIAVPARPATQEGSPEEPEPSERPG